MKKALEVVRLIHSLMNDKSNYTARLQAESLVKEYARQKCKEQRELCFISFKNAPKYDTYENIIREAPEPEFD